ncbi:l-ascorbate oxidase like protein [Quercus suber]|uniref:L-ascorbate oxidase like protein n=1 Tax=Quercus suber TaxID=58331 RepID=A0AAW0LRG5_QUESU
MHTLATTSTTLDGSLEPNELISFANMIVMSGCANPLPTAPIVPMVMKNRSNLSAKVYPRSWTAIYMALDNVGMWNIRSENWARQYLGQQFYLRVYSPANSWRDEYPIPKNAILCGRARGRHTRPLKK